MPSGGTTRLARCADVARLQWRCSAPEYRDLSSSLCPKSHGSSGAIGNPHLAHTAAPDRTNGSNSLRHV